MASPAPVLVGSTNPYAAPNTGPANDFSAHLSMPSDAAVGQLGLARRIARRVRAYSPSNLVAAYRRRLPQNEGDCNLARVAYQRHLQSTRESGARQNPDNFVGRLLTEEELARAQTDDLSAYRERAFYHYLLARTLHYDAVLLRGLREGVEQIVLFGAGLDTRAYRFADEIRLAGAHILETDLPGPLLAKQQRLQETGSFEHVRYMPLDLVTADYETWASAARLDWTKKSLFIAEGVSLYVNTRTVQRWLRFLRTVPDCTVTYDMSIASWSDELFRALLRKAQFRLPYNERVVRRFHARQGMNTLAIHKSSGLQRELLRYEPPEYFEHDMAVILGPAH